MAHGPRLLGPHPVITRSEPPFSPILGSQYLCGTFKHVFVNVCTCGSRRVRSLFPPLRSREKIQVASVGCSLLNSLSGPWYLRTNFVSF